MGINGATNLLWSATGITLKSLLNLNIDKQVDVDNNAIASWQKFGKGKPISNVIEEIAVELKMIAHSAGMTVTVVVNGDTQPDCKRASLHRCKWRQLDDISLTTSRMKVVLMSSVIRMKKENLQDTTVEEEELKKYESVGKSLESSSARNVFKIPSDFGQ